MSGIVTSPKLFLTPDGGMPPPDKHQLSCCYAKIAHVPESDPSQTPPTYNTGSRPQGPTRKLTCPPNPRKDLIHPVSATWSTPKNHSLSDAANKWNAGLVPRWTGPFEVAERLGSETFKIRVQEGKWSSTTSANSNGPIQRSTNRLRTTKFRLQMIRPTTPTRHNENAAAQGNPF
jgi:hypothetical protein